MVGPAWSWKVPRLCLGYATIVTGQVEFELRELCPPWHLRHDDVHGPVIFHGAELEIVNLKHLAGRPFEPRALDHPCIAREALDLEDVQGAAVGYGRHVGSLFPGFVPYLRRCRGRRCIGADR